MAQVRVCEIDIADRTCAAPAAQCSQIRGEAQGTPRTGPGPDLQDDGCSRFEMDGRGMLQRVLGHSQGYRFLHKDGRQGPSHRNGTHGITSVQGGHTRAKLPGILSQGGDGDGK